MLLCFIDESGSTKNPKPDEVFVLAGVAVPVTEWGAIDARVEELKSNHGLGRTEIHCTHLYHEYQVQQRIPDFDQLDWKERRRAVQMDWKHRPAASNGEKKQRHQRLPYVHLTRRERTTFLQELCTLLADAGSIYITVEACNVARFQPNSEAAWVVAFESLVNDFQMLLNDPGQARGMSMAGSRPSAVPLLRVYWCMMLQTEPISRSS